MTGKQRATASPRRATHDRGANTRRLRIIAGQWRGRRWKFPEAEIRPTSERIRETLFNWLQSRVSGRRCLDLYAGSGALGLEALSRGAAHCVFVDQNAQAIAAIGDVLREWGAGSEAAELLHCRAEQYLKRAARPFDLVFLDPPFAGAALAEVATQLQAKGWLSPGCLVYFEHPRMAPLPALAEGWEPLRDGVAGAVGYDLYEYR
ncbi:MAG TPA: 16S rRNA (guanine(966)-N(2))-methyltransferase RsmD [Steroidobacteraceae bacterium]|jgi:16S rRNA (guanine966-N2)-methyltransferase|nr:16S rRNA (guanine(966)-N(2))-methyltransferase RsmD [Steroidobacteraceae bacterium]